MRMWVSKAIVEFSPDGQTVLFTFLCPIMAQELTYRFASIANAVFVFAKTETQIEV